MLNGELFRELLTERLTSVGLEIWGIFEQTIATYETEIKRSAEETARVQRLLDICIHPETKQHRADVQQPFPLEPPQIKDEQELWSSQGESQLVLIYQTPTAENSGDSLSINTTGQIKAEPVGEDYGVLQPAIDSQCPSFVSSDCPTVPCLEEEGGGGLLSELKSSKSKRTQIAKLEISLSQVHPAPEKLKLPIEDLPRGKKPFKGGGVPEPASDCRYPAGVTQHCPTAQPLEDESVGLLAEMDPRTSKTTLQKQSFLSQVDSMKNSELYFPMEGLLHETGFVVQRHEQTTHGDLQYQCHKCGKFCDYESNLHDGMRTHTGEKPYQCQECSQGFSQEDSVPFHMKTHTGGKSYQCQECGKAFNQNVDLQKHMSIHTAEKLYWCHECGKGFSARFNLQCHMRIHTGEKPFKCQECSKGFSLKCNLINHMRTHTGQKPYQCQVCGKHFSQRYNLYIHMRIHTGERPYQCQVCGKSFIQKCDLKKHIRIHTGEKPYQCQQCGKSFSDPSALSSHIKTHTRVRS